MIIDFHTHTFPDKIAAGTIDLLSRKAHILPYTDATVSQLQTSMKRAGIDLSVVLPVATTVRQVEHINDRAAQTNERTQETGILSFGCMHPDFEGYHEELARIRDLGLKGIKIHPVYQGVDIDDIRYMRIFDRAAQLGLIVITHAGLDIGFPGVVHCSPLMCRHVVDEVGDFSFILAHMGGWRNWEEVPEYLADTCVFLDTAFSEDRFVPLPDGWWKDGEEQMLTQKEFLHLKDVFGADRLLFGTDCPWSGQAESLAYLEKLTLTADEKEKILGGNAAKLLGWQSDL